MKKINRKWNQKISEYVGSGHPDRVADEIANIINKGSFNSATEVIINKSILLITGETKPKDKSLSCNQAKEFLKKIIKEYKNLKLPKVFMCVFPEQDTHLKFRAANKIAGDQEVSYYTNLDKHDIHFWLRKWDDVITKNWPFCDYKIVVDTVQSLASISISDGYKNWGNVLEYLFKNCSNIGIEKIKTLTFSGGCWKNDTGVTGRKLIVEGAGCGYPHGGGAIYGKDSTKTAVAGYNHCKELAEYSNYKTTVCTFVPGNELENPQVLREFKNEN